MEIPGIREKKSQIKIMNGKKFKFLYERNYDECEYNGVVVLKNRYDNYVDHKFIDPSFDNSSLDTNENKMLDMTCFPKIFITHYSKLIDRKSHLMKQFSLHNIENFEFIELFDKNELSMNQINQFTLSPGLIRSGE